MTDIERQILLNQLAMLEALAPITQTDANSTRELMLKRYHETAKLIREKQIGE